MEPVGVVGQIIPWNFPLLMLAWKIAPALAMGNTVVLKPAEFTLADRAAFAELCRGGRAAAGRGEHRHRRRRDRRGSGRASRRRQDRLHRLDRGRPAHPQATAGSGKKLSLELGGKSPFIVFDDADLDSVVEGVVDAIWFNQGQVCCAGSRILVQEGSQNVWSPSSRRAWRRFAWAIRSTSRSTSAPSSRRSSWRRLAPGASRASTRALRCWQPSWSCPQDGCFYPPTLFTDVSPAATIAQVEIFGPVVVLMTFRTPGRSGGARQQHAATASPPASGARTSTWRSTSRPSSRPARSGSIVPMCSTPPAASAATGRAASAEKAAERGSWEYVKSADGRTDGQVGQESDRSRAAHAAANPKRCADGYRPPPVRPSAYRHRPHPQTLHRRQTGPP